MPNAFICPSSESLPCCLNEFQVAAVAHFCTTAEFIIYREYLYIYLFLRNDRPLLIDPARLFMRLFHVHALSPLKTRRPVNKTWQRVQESELKSPKFKARSADNVRFRLTSTSLRI